MIKYSHYTTFGLTCPPVVADAEGFIVWRKGFELSPKDSWTRSERWIDAQERRIEAAR